MVLVRSWLFAVALFGLLKCHSCTLEDFWVVPNFTDYVLEGSSLVLHCRRSNESFLMVSFVRSGVIMGQDCTEWDESHYKIDCGEKRFEQVKELKFIIKAVRVEDDDMWLCNHNHQSRNLTIRVFAPVQPIEISIKSHESTSNVTPKQDIDGIQAIELGDNSSITLEVTTSCGFPKPLIEWFTYNMAFRFYLPANEISSVTTQCKGSPKKSVASSSLRFSCSSLKQYGSVVVYATVKQADYAKSIYTKPLKILCPYPSTVPAMIHKAEIIGFVIQGISMTLCSLVFVFCAFRQCRKGVDRQPQHFEITL